MEEEAVNAFVFCRSRDDALLADMDKVVAGTIGPAKVVALESNTPDVPLSGSAVTRPGLSKADSLPTVAITEAVVSPEMIVAAPAVGEGLKATTAARSASFNKFESVSKISLQPRTLQTRCQQVGRVIYTA